jgi:hypothetical protein
MYLDRIDKKSNELFLQNFENLDYDKNKIQLIINNKSGYDLSEYIDKKKYNFYEELDGKLEDIYNQAIKKDSEYFFLLTNRVNIKYSNLLKFFINFEIGCIAPLFVRVESIFSNFWGKIDKNGFYERSDDYYDIVTYRKKGVFKVPYISQAIFIKREIAIKTENFLVKGEYDVKDWDMIFCENMRKINIPMYLFNYDYFGDYFSEEIIENRKELSIKNIYHPDWEKKYLEKEFIDFIKDNKKELSFKEPIPYAYDFPLFTSDFCDELILEAESKNNWSNGNKKDTNKIDKRIGAVENVPTIDIHLKQFGMDSWWNIFLRKYMKKLLGFLYPGTSPKGFNIAFVVKYEPSGQPALDPHHDSSHYTLNIALSEYGVDYEGGGSHFIKTDYKHIGQRKGNCLIHPGKLTHYHAGLPTTKGKRYIFVSFCN